MRAEGTAMTGSSMRQGGRIIADSLAAQGVTHVFSVPGESFLPVLDGLHALDGRIRLVTCRFEAGAVNMAEAHGKLTGRPGVAFVTRGPGACHGSIGVHIAQQDSTPLVLFVGQIPHEETDRESFQEVDYRRMFAPLAKWVTQIDDIRRIPEQVAHAFDVAVSGRPGPVVVALSEEMQQQHAALPDITPQRIAPAHPDPAAMAELRERLARAERPLAILGGASWSSAGRAALHRFLRGSGIPVAVSFRRQSCFPGDDPLYAGDLGVGSDPALVTLAKQADLVLALGTRLGEPVSQGYTLFDLAGTTPIIHAYPDRAEIGRVHRVALGIPCDLDAFAEAAAALPPLDATRWAGWRAALRSAREAGLAPVPQAGELNLSEVMRELDALLPDDAILTSDAGNFATWVTRFTQIKDRQRFLGPANGAMGYAVPAAVGAAVTNPGRMVVGCVGDGGMLMTGQEIATAFHEGAAPILLVFDNGMYGTIRMYQERTYPGRVSGTRLTNPDFAAFIEAFGGHGETVTRTAEFAPAFGRAVASGKPALIALRYDPQQITSRATVADLNAQAAAAR
jgi:acetolactate synthase-1/2/3 large subunit